MTGEKPTRTSFILSFMKFFVIYSILSLLAVTSFAAETLIGYINGQKIGVGVAPNDRMGTIMLTTDRCDLNWGDIIVRGSIPFSENWQSYRSMFPDNWALTSGQKVFYHLTGERERKLNVYPENAYTRIVYAPGAREGKGGQIYRFTPPYELIVNVEASGASVSGFRLRVGIGAPAADNAGSLQCYQIAIHENVVNLRDRQDERVFEMPYEFPLGLVTLRLIARQPIPVRFTDANQETVDTIGLTGGFITVEDRNANSNASTAQQVTVKVTTGGGDSEQFALNETWKNSSVFINERPIQVGATKPTSGNGIIEGLGSEAVTVSYGNVATNAKFAF